MNKLYSPKKCLVNVALCQRKANGNTPKITWDQPHKPHQESRPLDRACDGKDSPSVAHGEFLTLGLQVAQIRSYLCAVWTIVHLKVGIEFQTFAHQGIFACCLSKGRAQLYADLHGGFLSQSAKSPHDLQC